MLIHLEKKTPKRRLTQKQRQSIMGLCIALGALLVTLCVVILIRMDRKKDDSILKLAEVEDYTRYTEEEFQEITDNDDVVNLGWFYYNLDREEKEDILCRFPFLKTESIQSFSYVPKEEVTDDMEVIGTDTYNDTEERLVREYVSPIDVAKERYDDAYKKYQEARDKIEEKGEYEKVLNEHHDLIDDVSQTQYLQPQILYKWWNQAEGDGKQKEDSIILTPDSENTCTFHINYLAFGKSENGLSVVNNNEYAENASGAQEFLLDYKSQASSPDDDVEDTTNYKESVADRLIDIMKEKGKGAMITIYLSSNERCSTVATTKDDDNKNEDGKNTGDDITEGKNNKQVYITKIQIKDAPLNLTISGYDKYLQVPSNAERTGMNVYLGKDGKPNRTDRNENGEIYYTRDVAVIDFAYQCPNNYVPAAANISMFKYSGARFSTLTYNYKKSGSGKDENANFMDNASAGASTLGFNNFSGGEYKNDTLGFLSGFPNPRTNINITGNTLTYGAAQSITSVKDKNTDHATMTQILHSSNSEDTNYHKKENTVSGNLDNFTVQINLHMNTKEGAGRKTYTYTDSLGRTQQNPGALDLAKANTSSAADRFLTRTIAKYGGSDNDQSATLYILLGQNREELRFHLMTAKEQSNKWYIKTGKKEITDNEITGTGRTGTSKTLNTIVSGNFTNPISFDNNASLNDEFRLVGHKLRYISVERNTHAISDLDENSTYANEKFKTMPSYEKDQTIFAYGVGNIRGFQSITTGTGHELSELIWARNTVVGEDELDNFVAKAQRDNVNINGNSYHFINQAFKQKSTDAVSKMRFYYNNSRPRFRIVKNPNDATDNSIEGAITNDAQGNPYGIGGSYDYNEDEDSIKDKIVNDCYKKADGSGYLDREDKLLAFINTGKTADIINYEEDGTCTYTLAINLNGTANIKANLHNWLRYINFAVYDIEDYENGLAGIHEQIKQVGSYQITTADEDKLKSTNHSLGFNRLYITDLSNETVRLANFFYTKKANGDIKDQTDDGKVVKVTLMVRDRYRDATDCHSSWRKVKFKLLFVQGTIETSGKFDTSHIFSAEAFKSTLNSKSYDHYDKTKEFVLYEVADDGTETKIKETNDKIADLPFFGTRLKKGKYKFTSKLTFSHKSGCQAWCDFVETPGNRLKCKKCGHKHSGHSQFCKACCTEGKTDKTKPDVTAEAVIEIVNNPPVAENTQNITKTEEETITTDEVIAMFSAKDGQDLGIHNGDDTELTNGCAWCFNWGYYSLSGGTWGPYTDPITQTSYKVYTVTYPDLINPSVLNSNPNVQIFVPVGLSMSGYPNDTGRNKSGSFIVSCKVTDADGESHEVTGEVTITPTIGLPENSTLTYHTNETISHSDILNSVKCLTGFGDECGEGIYNTGDLYIQSVDSVDPLNKMKWNIPLAKVKDGQWDGLIQDNSVCRKANSIKTEKEYVVTILFTHPRDSTLTKTGTCTIKIVNDPPYAESVTPYLLKVGEEWTEEMFFKWWSCNAYDFEDGNRSLTAKDYDQPSHDLNQRHADAHKKYQIDKSKTSCISLDGHGLISNGNTYLHRFHITDWAGYEKVKEGISYFNTDIEVEDITLQAVYYDEDGASYNFPIHVYVQKPGIPTSTPSGGGGTSNTDDPNTSPSRQPVTQGPGIPTQTDHPIESEGPKPTKPSVTTDPNAPTNKPSESYTDSKQYKTRYISKDFIDELPEYGGLAYDNTWSKYYSDKHGTNNYYTLWESLSKNVDNANNTNNWEGCQFVFVFDKEDIKKYQDMIYNYAVTGKLNNNVPTWDFNDELWKKLEENNNIKKSINMEHKCIYKARKIKAATCTENGAEYEVCKTCGSANVIKTIPLLGHCMEETSVGAGTCTEAKITTRRCIRCDYKEDPVTTGGGGHDCITTVVNPTCTSRGYTKDACKNCTYSITYNYTDMVDHNFEFVKEENPTCSEQGYTKYLCSSCKEEEKYVYTNPLGHILSNSDKITYSPAKDKTDCTQTIYKLTACDREGCNYVKQEIVIPADTHNLVDHRKDVTCVTPGTIYYTCNNLVHGTTECNYKSETEDIEALGHVGIIKSNSNNESGYLYDDVIADYQDYIDSNGTSGTDYSSLFYRKLGNGLNTLADIQENVDYIWNGNTLYTITTPYKCTYTMTGTGSGKYTDATFDNSSEGIAQAYCVRSKRYDWGETNNGSPCGEVLPGTSEYSYALNHAIFRKIRTVKTWEEQYQYKYCSACGGQSEKYNITTNEAGLYGENSFTSWNDLITNRTIELDTFSGQYITKVNSEIKGKLRIPDNIKGIEEEAFLSCSQLEEVEANGSLSLEDGVFSGCVKLEKITIKGTCNKISNNVFQGCSSLEVVDLATNITEIGDYAFYQCTSLKSVNIADDVLNINGLNTIGKYAFYGCTSLENFNLQSTVSIKEYTFYNCTSLTSTDLSNVRYIEDSAFENCESLRTVTAISNYMETIGNKAFKNCESLTWFAITNVATSIGSGAFENCTSLPSITIPGNIKIIESNMFKGCTSLTSVTIENEVKGIKNNAFENCTSIETISIPNSVIEIGDSAFKGCTSLKTVNSFTFKNQLISTLQSYHVTVSTNAFDNTDLN